MHQSITLTFDAQQIITWLIVGLIAGILAGLLVRGRRFGLFGAIVIGLLGALLGGFLFTFLRIQLPPAFYGGITLQCADIFISFVGAVLVLLIFGAFFRYGRPLF